MTITFTQEEINALLWLIDSGVRHRGLEAVTNAAHIYHKVREAAEAEVLPEEDS